MADYHEMWASLGLDLKTHDAVLDIVGKAYQDIFLSQKNRPKGMSYFDFVVSEIHGLRIKEIMDAKAQGRKVIGTFCVFVPEELVLAVDAVCIGLCAGAELGFEEAEKFLPRNTCSLIKAAFGFKLAKVCPYIETTDLVVGENTCEFVDQRVVPIEQNGLRFAQAHANHFVSCGFSSFSVGIWRSRSEMTRFFSGMGH